MILVDTSIWVNHLRRHDAVLAAHLEAGEVLCHPYVIGEIGLGLLKQRQKVIDLLVLLSDTVQRRSTGSASHRSEAPVADK